MTKRRYYSVRMRASKEGVHISGAEGIYQRDEINKMLQKYSLRAFSHEKGRADEIFMKVEELKETPRNISTLSLSTLNTRSPQAVQKTAVEILTSV
ncbi:MAG: 6-carboxyhexanoate--CoA ligase, partial [Thermodesulfovibrionia bacterium]|nr:6-carboxyhexanoate--CoA ligase [Thermodesulfovibrionia bacterium]